MEKNKKKIRVIYWAIIILGSLILGIVTAALEWNDFMRKVTFISWVSIMGIGAFAINLAWGMEFTQKLNKINLILNEERDPDRYILELNALMEGKRSFQLRQLHLINLGAAYSQKEDYEKAKSLLLKARAPKIGINKVIYWADLAMVYFYLKEDEAACAIIEAQKDNFEKFKDHKQVGGTLAVLSLFHLAAMGEKNKLRQQLSEAKEKWENKQNKSDFIHLESLVKD